MRFKEITIERNFRISNDDQYAKERISATIELDDSDDEQFAMNIAREKIIENFKQAYPNVYTHLNFEETIKAERKVHEHYPLGIKPNLCQSTNSYQPQPIDTSFNLIEEIEKAKSITLLKVYKPMCKTDKEKEAYELKAFELTETSKTN